MTKQSKLDPKMGNTFQRHCDHLVIFAGVCCVLIISKSITHQAVAQENRPWMISGSALRGLFGGRTDPNAQVSWTADVEHTEWQYIVIHHSATKSGSVEAIHGEHLKRRDAEGNPWLGIGYHFVIGNGQGMPDGTVQSTFRWKEQIHGAHSGSALFNIRGIGICLIGDFESAPPSRAQLESLKSLVKVLSARHRIAPENLMGHGSIKATACPGKHFPLNEVRQVIPKIKS